MADRRRIVQLDVPASDAELAADVLWLAGPSAVAVSDAPGGRVRLVADVLDGEELAVGRPAWELTVLELDSDSYLDAWRAWARPVRAGRRVVLHPAWLPVPAALAGGDLVVVLDPGRAFGSGSHPSTRLAVAALEDLVAPGGRVLDVGTGSGVLAVVAARLGAASVIAVDLDPEALEVAPRNAAANGVADRVSVSGQPLADVGARFDVVVANIGAAVLRSLAADLATHVAPGGALVLSGLLAGQADDVVAALGGLREVDRRAEDGWVAPVLRAPAS